MKESITETSDNNPSLEIQTAPLIQLDIYIFIKLVNLWRLTEAQILN